MKGPELSVIIPVLDGRRFLRAAVGSVRREAPAAELVVVDDGSSDGSPGIARALSGPLQILETSGREGPAAARNLGLSAARGRLVMYLDVDDELAPGAVARLRGSLLAIDEEGVRADVIKGRTLLLGEQPVGGLIELGLSGFPHHLGGAIYRRTDLDRVGPLDSTLRFGEDSDWHHRAAELGLRFRLLDAVTQLVRRHADNMTRGRSQRELGRLEVARRVIARRRAQSLAGGEVTR